MNYTKPTLVAPGGSLEKAYLALEYGADAVYVGMNHFGLRKSANNLSFQELKYLCMVAKKNRKHVYLTMNIFPHESDIKKTPAFFNQINSLTLSALIISDIGLLSIAKKHTHFPIHVSTQASIMNSASASFWKSLGASRVVLGRETSLEEARIIKQNSQCETEVFIHGAMCSSFSGKCTISNVTSGRDSNRGGCIQSCRHTYQLSNENHVHIMNSKDLMGISLIPDYFKSKIDAVKIEGRMKSVLYVVNTVKQYRHAIDAYHNDPNNFNAHLSEFKKNLTQVSNRGFTEASLITPASKSSISFDWNGYNKTIQFVGITKKTSSSKTMIHAKYPIKSGESIQYISPNNHQITTIKCDCFSSSGKEIDQFRPNEIGWLHGVIPKHSVLLKVN